MKKKHYLAVRKVRKFIAKQPVEVQAEYLNIIDRLEQDGYLVVPYARKLETDLFEIRIRRGRQIRVLYYYHRKDLIFGVHAFVKKTQKTPQQDIKQAKRVIKLIRNGKYDEE